MLSKSSHFRSYLITAIGLVLFASSSFANYKVASTPKTKIQKMCKWSFTQLGVKSETEMFHTQSQRALSSIRFQGSVLKNLAELFEIKHDIDNGALEIRINDTTGAKLALFTGKVFLDYFHFLVVEYQHREYISGARRKKNLLRLSVLGNKVDPAEISFHSFYENIKYLEKIGVQKDQFIFKVDFGTTKQTKWFFDSLKRDMGLVIQNDKPSIKQLLRNLQQMS